MFKHSPRSLTIALAAVALALSPTGTSAAPPTPTPTTAPTTVAQASPLRVVVSIPPLIGLVQPLLPPGSTIDTLIPPGVSEHGYEIPASKLRSLSRADMVVTVGLDLEPQADRALARSQRDGRAEVVFARVVQDQINAAGSAAPTHDCGHDHSSDHTAADDGEHIHGPGCTHHHHAAIDPHLWLDPVMARALAQHVGGLLAARAASEAARSAARERTAAQLARIDAIDADYRALAERAQRRTVVVGHDAYGWLARRYGFTTVPIKGLHATEPTPRDLDAARKAVIDQRVPVVFVEPQLSQDAGRRIAAAAGAEVRVLDPLGDGDWFALMQRNLAELEYALDAKPTQPQPASPARVP